MGSTVADAVVRILVHSGIRRAYTALDEVSDGLIKAMSDEPGLSVISARHEAGAGFMAAADGRIHGVPAIALGGCGASAAGLLGGVHTAFTDETPMLVLLGQGGSNEYGLASSRAVDLAAMYSPVSAWSAEAMTVAEVPRLIAQALEIALGRNGPVVLSVPTDFWTAKFDQPIDTTVVTEQKATAHARVAAEVAKLAEHAHYPVAIVGSKARDARAQLFILAERFGFAVYNAFGCQDVFPEDHPNYAGYLGHEISVTQLDALERADLVLALGASLDAVTTQQYRYPTKTSTLVLVAQGKLQPRRGGLTFLINSAVLPFLTELYAAASPRSRNWSIDHAAVREFMTAPKRDPSALMHPAGVVRTARKLAPRDAMMVDDAGVVSGFVHRYWCFTEPRTQLTACDGAQGYAIPAAVVAKLTEPDRTVLVVMGDRSALSTGQEIETAVRYCAPIAVLILQNALTDTIGRRESTVTRRVAAASKGLVDFASWARGLGAAGFTVDNADELEPALEAALLRQRPCVIDVRVDSAVVAETTAYPRRVL